MFELQMTVDCMEEYNIPPCQVVSIRGPNCPKIIARALLITAPITSRVGNERRVSAGGEFRHVGCVCCDSFHFWGQTPESRHESLVFVPKSGMCHNTHKAARCVYKTGQSKFPKGGSSHALTCTCSQKGLSQTGYQGKHSSKILKPRQ